MRKLTRKQALAAIFAAGTTSDHAAFIRHYVENRISYTIALAEFRRGKAFAAKINAREAANLENAGAR